MKVRPLPCSIVLLDVNPERSLARFYEDTYRPRRLITSSAATVKDYRIAVRRLSQFAGCHVTLDQLSDELIERFMGWLVAMGRSPALANHYVRSLLAMWRFAFRKGLVATQPQDVTKLRLLKRMPEAWSLEELERILAACRKQEGDAIENVPANVWWPAFVLLLYYTALRVSAALALRSEHMNWSTGELFVPGTIQKHRADWSFQLPPALIELLIQSGAKGRSLLLPHRYNLPAIRNRYGRILKGARLPTGRRNMFHKIRRTSATFLADALGEAAAMQHLGHSALSVTRTYLDPTKIRRIDVAKALPAPRSEV